MNQKFNNYESDNTRIRKTTIFCSNCGKKIDINSKYCNFCGMPISNTIESENKELSLEERKLVYDGKIHKCPNCGEVLKSFIATCPTCGFELSRKEIPLSLKEFNDKIEKYYNGFTNKNSEKNNIEKNWFIKLIEILFLIGFNIAFFGVPLILYFAWPLAFIKRTPKLTKEEQQLSNFIENFSFPNDRESILAALFFMKEKINFLSNQSINRKSVYWLNLWGLKAEQLKQKADILLPNDSIIEKNYNFLIKDINESKKVVKRKSIIGFILIIFAIVLFYSCCTTIETDTNK